MNILLFDGNEKEASDRYTKLGMDTQFLFISGVNFFPYKFFLIVYKPKLLI